MTEKKNTTNELLSLQKSAVVIISINKPRMNPMSLEFFDELEVLIPKLAADKLVRAIVITAEGKENFSVSMDLKHMAQAGNNFTRVQDILNQRLRVLSVIENIGNPVIATLFGYCLGGGLGSIRFV